MNQKKNIHKMKLKQIFCRHKNKGYKRGDLIHSNRSTLVYVDVSVYCISCKKYLGEEFITTQDLVERFL